MASATTEMRLDPSTGWTCLACNLVFSSGQLQRDHYRGEWHLYNMKRQIAGLPPVTECDFLEKLKQFSQHQQQEHAFSSSVSAATPSLPPSSTNLSSSSLVCAVCRNKRFRSRNAFDNHLQSRRHKEEAEEAQQQRQQQQKAAHECQTEDAQNGGSDGEQLAKIATDGCAEAVLLGENDSDDDDGVKKEGEIPPNECLFCDHNSDTWQENLAHMTRQHGFLIPDAPFCTDVPGLLTYLGFKVGVGLTCVRCQCARFRSLDALRKHMRDSNHCNFRIDSQQQEQGDVLLEFMDFYDYSTEPNEGGEGDGEEEEEDDECQQKRLDSVLYDEGAFLVLPSGARIGHRSLVRYFRQRLGYGLGGGNWHPEQRQLTNAKKSHILNQLGGTTTAGSCRSVAVLEASVKARARDISFMKRTVARYQLRRALASNKLFRSRGRNDQQ